MPSLTFVCCRGSLLLPSIGCENFYQTANGWWIEFYVSFVDSHYAKVTVDLASDSKPLFDPSVTIVATGAQTREEALVVRSVDAPAVLSCV